MRWRTRGWAAVASLSALCAGPAAGSGGPPPEPLYIDPGGGTPAEMSRLYAGRLGVLMPSRRRHRLYLDWRLLNGLKVGEDAGKALSAPCCDEVTIFDSNRGLYAWLNARRAVPGAADSPLYISTERAGPDYTSIPNCFPDAFDNATATLARRIARYGRHAESVKAWLLTQDKVFDTCGTPGVTLPALMPGAPEWLKADRAYQEAAWALYDGRNVEAAERFGAISRDSGSPWRPMGLYLKVRATQREALARRSASGFAAARAAIAELAASPEGTYGRGEARKMLRALDYREQPDRLRMEIEAELGLRQPKPDIAVAFRDYLGLTAKTAEPPPVLDWLDTFHTEDRRAALDHSMKRWAATREDAWLLAALSLVGRTDPEAAGLIRDAERVERGELAWLSTRYHLIRLTMAQENAARTRSRLDSLLARTDLTLSERNLFSAARTQVAIGLHDLAHFGVRRAYCASYDGICSEGAEEYTEGLARVGPGETYGGFGPDARAVIDRLPLRQRVAFSRLRTLPRELRLDLALTNFARAVQLQDDRATEAMANDLTVLLPQLRQDWRRIATARPGPARRFALAFAMAKLPGLRTDLAMHYTRPVGTVRAFQGNWQDWLILPRGIDAGEVEFPGIYVYSDNASRGPGEEDVVCQFQCGQGGFPLQLPAFVEAARSDSAAERRAFVDSYPERKWPEGTIFLWEEALAYARANRADPRVPELLYRLIRVDRWGGAPDQLGRRAFQLIHARYPKSIWAKRSPYYYN